MERITDFVGGLVGSRFPDLASHQNDVAVLVQELGRAIGCTFEELSKLAISSKTHDIGKLSVSEAILNKVSRLTDSERQHIRRHSEIGYTLLKPLRLGAFIEDAVLHHHENFDGSGYPGGLKGDAIPLQARIIRICDSFDALTADRAYHRGIPRDEALTKLEDSSHWYDPELLKTFFGMMGH